MNIDDMNREEIKQFADSVNTSFVIIDEIFNMCEQTHKAREILEDPTSEQKSSIMEIAWANTEDDELHWKEETYIREDIDLDADVQEAIDTEDGDIEKDVEEDKYMALVVKNRNDGVIGVGKNIHEARDDAEGWIEYNVYAAVTDYDQADSGEIVEVVCNLAVYNYAKKYGLGFRNINYNIDDMILELIWPTSKTR